jgi:phosphatidyl-myo-inositol dimannoside synthase
MATTSSSEVKKERAQSGTWHAKRRLSRFVPSRTLWRVFDMRLSESGERPAGASDISSEMTRAAEHRAGLGAGFRRRLLLLTEVFPPGVGGVQSYLRGLWSQLPRGSATVIAPQDPAADAWDRAQSFAVVRTAMHGIAYPRWRPALQTLARTIEETRPDAIVCGKALFEGRAVRALNAQRAPMAQLPFVVCAYGMEIQTWLSKRKTRRDLLGVLHAAARIVVINSAVRTLLADAGIPERKFVKIYPGIDDTFFASGAHYSTGASRKNIVTIARLVPRKGIDVVLRALPAVLSDVRDVTYTIVGDGPERARLAALSRKLGIDAHVRFLGACSNDELHRALAAADAFVLTPRETSTDVEGFGIVFLEAAGSGVPSVGSRSGGVPEAVLDEKTGLLVPPDDPAATAAALVRILRDDVLRQRLGDAAQARARNEFTWSRRALLFQGMIEAVIQEAQRLK